MDTAEKVSLRPRTTSGDWVSTETDEPPARNDASATLTTAAFLRATVPEDSSLDAFASSAGGNTADAEEDATAAPEADEAETAETESVATATDSVEPAVSTYAWSPEGGTCADCGESAEKRWRAEGQRDGDLVCADCKEW